ncbi:MAG: hypothetical protein WAX69_11515 [Victivallales bacterium]
MSYFLADVNGYVGELASNRGLMDMTSHIEKHKKLKKLNKFINNGETEDMKGVLKDLKMLPSSGDPNIDITIKELKSLLRKASEIAIITDGVG